MMESREDQLAQDLTDLSDGQPVHIAQAFHEVYEYLAPRHGYETRKASAVPWDQVPAQNRELMVEVVETLLDRGVIARPRR